MATQDDPPTKIGELPLTVFELPKWLVEPAVRSCRLFNTALDFIFYDVPTLRAALAERDAPMQARGEKPPSRIIDFDALSDPEGSLLLIDATTAPYVHKYQSVEKFLESPYQETRDVDIATITGVGSSALGSAALAWDISVALKKPVLAIVPGVHRQHSWDKLGRLKKGVFLAHRSVHRSEDETAFQFGEGYGREGRQGHPPGDTQAIFGGGKDPDRFGRPARRG